MIDMPGNKKKDKNIKDVSAAHLLDEFTDPNFIAEEHPRYNMSDEEYVKMMVMKENERELIRTKQELKDLKSSDTLINESDDMPEIPAGSCPSCHFCTIIRKIGDTVYCVCANPERSIEGMFFDHRMWVRSEPNLECHRESPMIKVQKQIRQYLDEKSLQKVRNESLEVASREKESLAELEVLNLFDENMALVEEDPEIEDSVLPKIRVQPPNFRKKLLETDSNEVLSSVQDTSKESLNRNEMIDTLFREEIIAVHKHKALETLKKYRKDRPVEVLSSKEEPIAFEKIAPLKRCDNCYFCADEKRLGGSSWCHCTNVGRSRDGPMTASWVRSRLNAPCWKRLESITS